MNEARPGDLYLDERGKLWRVIAYSATPTVTVEEVEPEPQSNPALLQQFQGLQQFPKTLPLPPRNRLSGGISGAMWDGWKRIFQKETASGDSSVSEPKEKA